MLTHQPDGDYLELRSDGWSGVSGIFVVVCMCVRVFQFVNCCMFGRFQYGDIDQ